MSSYIIYKLHSLLLLIFVDRRRHLDILKPIRSFLVRNLTTGNCTKEIEWMSHVMRRNGLLNIIRPILWETDIIEGQVEDWKGDVYRQTILNKENEISVVKTRSWIYDKVTNTFSDRIPDLSPVVTHNDNIVIHTQTGVVMVSNSFI